MMAVYVLGVLPSLGQTLVETHAIRQTQTAYTAVLYADRGIDLLRPPLPILGPPGSIPQEFPIVQAAGAVLIDAGMAADTSMRVVGLISLLSSAALVFVLGRRLMSATGALVALGAFLFNAHAWVYGRASLIEYTATAGGLALLYFAIRWMDGGRIWHWAAALLAGCIGVLVKITTGGFYLLPILLWRSSSGRFGFQRASVWALIGVSVAVGLAWSGYAQQVREETPASLFLSMDNQLAWFFGSLGQRIDLANWRVPFVALITLTGFGIVLWAPMAVVRVNEHPQKPLLVALLALVVLVPLLLFNLYSIHDYYWAAVAPIVALGIGLGAEWLWANGRRPWVRRAAVGLAGAWIATIIGTFPTWSIIYGTPRDEAPAMRIAAFVRDHSQRDDWVVLRGWSWNATFLYYARRQGLAIPDADPFFGAGEYGTQDLAEIDFDAILADPVFGPFIFCDRHARCELEGPP